MSTLISNIFDYIRGLHSHKDENQSKIKASREYLKYLSDNRKQVMSASPKKKNCISTALYIVGETALDRYIYGDKPEKILSDLKEASSPRTGYIAAWKRKYDSQRIHREYDIETIHAAVIVKEDPLLVSTRNGCDAFFHKSMPITDVNEIYKSYDFLTYYIPKKLEEKACKSK